jgi:protein O-GlcNAc transferase
MKKIISFCLWGNDRKYCIGAVKNSQLYKIIYPDWICRFYIGSDVDINIIRELIKNDCEIVIIPSNTNSWTNLLWRFKPSMDLEVDVFICRDTDSRLNFREKFAVDEWLKSDKSIHIMRDHPYHNNSMLAGMVGYKKQCFSLLNDNLPKLERKNAYEIEYNFFNNVLYPIIKKDCIIHDEIFDKRPFPTKRLKNEFVGQVFDENDIANSDHQLILEQYLNENR